ncbi:pirin family protein [Ferruginibacter paludis]|uniref:pirin family protein n=1 Tax=Ferruginibacter paludis TaxID=1310417 RepID=UPI0025B4BB31|nr:pirin family protein [Ferruginibacter paludis]MDN3656143.1 pirin family protein [Ferruginibacter paludis]
MKIKHSLKKDTTGTGILSATSESNNLLNNNDELKKIEAMRHIPNMEGVTTPEVNFLLHKANSRGHVDHGWLESYHTFSFANYYNPERMHFGVLRVLNDDRVDPGKGFGRHPHDNMEIISIPLEGDLKHEDNMGNIAIIKHGDIQVMSAGTGIFHSEYNKNEDQQAKFLQIWLFPRTKNVAPRYDQASLNINDRRNNLQQILSPDSNDAGVWINQDAWFHIGQFDNDFKIDYNLKKSTNGVYAFVIKGNFSIAGIELNQRDGLGISNTKKISLKANSADAEVLLMEVPMTLG